MAYRVTLAMLVIFASFLLIDDAILGDVYFMWGLFFLPLSLASFILLWSVSTVFEYWSQSSYVDVEVTSGDRNMAVTIIILSVIFLIVSLLLP